MDERNFIPSKHGHAKDQANVSTSADSSDKSLCAICASITNEELVGCGDKGKRGLQSASINRGDTKFEQIDFSQKVLVHSSCRKTYTHQYNVESFKRKVSTEKSPVLSPPKRKLRRSESLPFDESTSSTSTTTFDWENNCFICSQEANPEKEKKKRLVIRKKICFVVSSGLKNSILELLQCKTDDFHREIFKRVSGELNLVALNARYHKVCFVELHKKYSENMKKPIDSYSDKLDQAMAEIYDFLLSSDDCQFTMQQLREVIKHSDLTPHEDTIKKHLKIRFGDQILISSKMGGITYICFSKNLHDILTTTWYNKERQEIELEEVRLIDAASELIRRKIRTTFCRTDQYPASDKIFDDVNKNIPPLLLRFLNNVIYKDKKQDAENEKYYSTKTTSISHAIMSASRPKSFISPLLLSTGTTLYRKFGSKKMIEICYNLGFSCNYKEVKLYEICNADQASRQLKNPFIQIVSDNSDFNLSTIDGKGTFHNLGSIEIITPANSLQERQPIARLTHSQIPKTSDLVDRNKIDVLLYTKKEGSGLQLIKVNAIEKNPTFTMTLVDRLNILWMFFKFVKQNQYLGWNGFMNMMLSCRENYEVSTINFLPFINAPPSEYSTLYTALRNASEIVVNEGMKTCIVTFDQPLYIKARDIVEAEVFDNVHMVVRLGGFHLLLSYMGCIGHIMGGSGITDILSLIYAEGSVNKLLCGNSYDYAVRAHILLQQALSLLIMDELKENNSEFKNLLDCVENLSLDMNIEAMNSNAQFKTINQIFECQLEKIEKRGNTAKLWVLYFRMVSLLKKFIAAERMGDWESHLDCLELMIPFFHASGHFNYSKSARLYLQDMKGLKSTMDTVEYEKFTTDGFFTSRRSNAYWAGIFSDQTIEQTLMRAMSVEGGPFKRGSSDSIVFKWIKGVIYTKDIIEGLEEFCHVQFSKSHQHVDSRQERIKRDANDVLILHNFLKEHNPFADIDNLRNVVSGMIGTPEINCYDALNVGIKVMKTLDGKNFKEIKQSKKDKVLPLLAVNSKVKIGDQITPIDPVLLFQRICVMKKSDEELRQFLKFELSPYPLSLFDDAGMRKTAKATLYPLFEQLNTTIDKNRSLYIIDGGMLLYRVKWPINSTYNGVFQEYVSYIKRNFGNHVIVVFDSYDSQSTKIVERNRRSQRMSCKEYAFDKEMHVPIAQDKFFSNYKNKNRFITCLMEELEKKYVKCYQASGEADELVVEKAIQDEPPLTKVIVAEDVDILVILTARATKEEIYFLKLGKQKDPSKLYSSKSFEATHPNTSNLIAFCHAFTGCDTTSAFFNKGKSQFFKTVESRGDIRQQAEIFYSSTSKKDEILKAGRYCAAILYKTAKEVPISKLKNIDDFPAFLEQIRFESFIKATTKMNAVKLASLIPTTDALDEHIKRCYFQIQVWLGNKNINATDWGWCNIEGCLHPVKMHKPPAPQELLKMIFCNCKKDCTSLCSCRKVGLFCNSTCGTCSGDNCLNSAPIIDGGREEENGEEEEAEEFLRGAPIPDGAEDLSENEDRDD